jgi:hypothetical protein
MAGWRIDRFAHGPTEKNRRLSSRLFFLRGERFLYQAGYFFLAAGSSIGIFLSIPFHALDWHGQ